MDAWGDVVLRCLQAQGLPDVTTVALVRCILSLIANAWSDHLPRQARPQQKEGKQSGDILKSLLSFIRYFVPTQQRVYELTTSSDAVNAIRTVCEGRPSSVKWREGRSWLLANSITWEEQTPPGGSPQVLYVD